MRSGGLLISAVMGLLFATCGCEPGFFAAVYYFYTTQPKPLRIETKSLPDAVVGTPYSTHLKATGGSSPYTWSVTNGSLPPGLSLDSSSGLVSGTPTNAGVYAFTVAVTDKRSKSASKSFTIIVNAGGTPLAITTASLPMATEGASYSATIEATGGATPYSWGIVGLPSGLTWMQVGDTLQISGTPVSGTSDSSPYSVVVYVIDSSSPVQNNSKTFSLVVSPSGDWYVDGVGGSDFNSGTSWGDAFRTIAKALSVATHRDTILVADATYYETDLNFNGKRIHLKGVDYHSGGLTRPVIDCQSGGRAFYFGSGETGDCVVDNFVIRNGRVEDGSGGGILCENNSSPTISNCVFEGNEVVDTNGWWNDETGGAICCKNSSNPTIVNCTFSDNSATGGGLYGYGGAIFCGSSSPSILNCTFIKNSADIYGGAIDCGNASNPRITNCLFSGNSTQFAGGAIACWDSSSPTVSNCTFNANHAKGSFAYGGAIYCKSSTATLNNCILWSNSASYSGNEIYIENSGSSCTLNYCCVDNTGYGGVTSNIIENNCIFADPQFADAANADYHLKSTSPCIDAGSNSLLPSGVDKDLDGNQRIVNGTVDIGAYEMQW
ncbi:MAG: hypothetical protein DRP63_06310 [Planctomycetota bacterium]|nr:MAG: hypothetical protein DRP63_06310 [Planctomycetota bacterium]